MVPMDVTLFEEQSEDGESLEIRGSLTDDIAGEVQGDDDGSGQEESRFYSCHVCGDNWLSIRRLDTEGDCKITFIHQMGVQPVLRRVAHVETEIVVADDKVRSWEYFLDETEVEEGEWLGRLADRRKVLKAICTN
jgi:hypothetical protein